MPRCRGRVRWGDDHRASRKSTRICCKLSVECENFDRPVLSLKRVREIDDRDVREGVVLSRRLQKPVDQPDEVLRPEQDVLAGGNDRSRTETVDGLLDIVAESFIQSAAATPVPDMCDVAGDLELELPRFGGQLMAFASVLMMGESR